MGEILDFLQKEDADIVVLQEVLQSDDPKLPSHYRSIETIQERMNYPYQDFAPALLDKYLWGIMLNGNAVLSKFPIISTKVTFFDKELDMSDPRDAFDPTTFATMTRNLQHVTLDTPSGEVNVFNFQGVWDLNGDNVSMQRQNMSDVIMRTIEGKQNVILAGDTNAKHTNPVMRRIETKLTNVFGDTLPTSFNMRRKDNPGYGTAVVDMIYASPNLKVITKDCPNVDVSDHLPLIATFSTETET